MNHTIHFILTGGTIDSFYDGTKDTAVPHKHSIIPSFIKTLKLYNPTKFTEVCMKDSRNITNTDRKNMVKTIKKSSSQKIIITHGTYTMPETARYLKSQLKRHDQTIILIGSMIPLSGFCPSDGPFNLGFAIAKIQNLPSGIYVCMNGRVFHPEEVVKVIKEGRFSSIFEQK